MEFEINEMDMPEGYARTSWDGVDLFLPPYTLGLWTLYWRSESIFLFPKKNLLKVV